MTSEYTVEDLKLLLYEEKIAKANVAYRAERKLKKQKRKAIEARGISEFGQDPMPSISLINERHLPDRKLFGKEVDLIPEEYRIPIILYGLIPNFIFLCCIAFIALQDY